MTQAINRTLGNTLPGILVANTVTLGLALWQGLALTDLMTAYWIQSVGIGVTSWLRLKNIPLERYAAEIATGPPYRQVNGRDITDPAKARKFDLTFFPIHYGGFHAIYLFAIYQFAGGALSIWTIAAGGVFLLAQAVPHLTGREDSAINAGNISPGAAMFVPYARILPMHLTIVFFGGIIATGIVLLPFTALKIAADVAGNWLEDKVSVRPSA